MPVVALSLPRMTTGGPGLAISNFFGLATANTVTKQLGFLVKTSDGQLTPAHQLLGQTLR